MIWLVDLDSTLSNLWVSWAYHHNHKCMICKEPLDPSKIDDWDASKFVKCGKNIYSYLHDQEIYLDAPINPGAQEAMEFLNDRHTVYIVTHCVHEGAVVGKYKWVRRYFPYLQNNIITIQDKSLLHGHVLIDDNVDNLLKARTKYRVAYHQKWNDPIKAINWHGKFKGITKMYSWGEIETLEEKFLW